MKITRSIALLIVFLMLFVSALPMFAAAEETSETVEPTPNITSGNAAVAYCIDDDQFLYSDRIDEKVAPTVAAKLVACMVASDILKERGLNSTDTQVTVTKTAIDNAGDIADVRVPMMGLKAGSSYSAKDLLATTLVACANDSVASIACDFGEKYLGGSINEFVDRMNKKVESLGLTQTNFVNPTGLDAPNQYTTPREVALIASAFYQYDELVKLCNVESYFFNGSSTVRNKNFLKSNYYVDGFLNKDAIGLIAGQLDRSGNYCLITASQKEGRTYIFVVMCAEGMIVERIDDKTHYSFGEGNAYVDMNKLIKWTRESFKLLTVANNDTIIGELRINAGHSSHVMVVPCEKVEKLVLDVEGYNVEYDLIYDDSIVYKKEFTSGEYDTIDAPVVAGQKVGEVVFKYNGAVLATVDAVAKDGVSSDGLKATLESIKSFLFGKTVKTILFIVIGIVVAWVIFSIVTAIVRAVKGLNGKETKKGKSKSDKSKKTKDTKSDKPKKHDNNTVTREIGKM